ncbi:MAG: metallophosphoesterase [Lentisphaeria bacterium]
MRLVHFSDVHLCRLPADPLALFDKRLAGGLNFLLRRGGRAHPGYLDALLLRLRTLAPELVVITGDLTTTGSPEEFAAVQERLAPLLSSRLELLYIPGNHDAYVGERRCRAALADAFQRFNRGRWRLDELPARLTLGPLTLLVADECRPTPPWLSCGEVAPAAAARLRAWLDAPREDGEKRLLVGHFPLRNAAGRPLGWRRRLNGAEPLYAALCNGRLDVALCGHDHTPFRRDEPNGAMELCAGAFTWHGLLNVLDYSPATGRFSQHWESVAGDGPAPALIGAIPDAAGAGM